jgi:hypothetical protein
MLVLPRSTPAQFTQQGPKLVGSGGVGGAAQGTSAALSADGNTVIIGGANDNTGTGAAWVFTRTNGIWSQQGSKLVGSDAVGLDEQGCCFIALSADGNTAAVGGPYDNSNTGAIWVYVRTNGVWTQQGSKLIGTGAIGVDQFGPLQGRSVALTAEGNTAIVGGPGDNGSMGAVWTFARTNGIWTQQGDKLVGMGAAGSPQQGYSVALSADGSTAVVGGLSDSGNTGAVWVFTWSSAGWIQQGSKLVGSDAVGNAQQGSSVALSSDGNTVVIGGHYDNSGVGAVWIFTRANGVWTQQGSKLVGSGAVGNAQQGSSVALSGDGNTVIVGGPWPSDNIKPGGAWVFTRNSGVWTQRGSMLVGNDVVGTAYQGRSVALSADGNTAVFGGPDDNLVAGQPTGAAWVFVRANPTNTHDFNDEGMSDIVWRDAGGNTAIWLMNGATVLSSGSLGAVPTIWSVVGQRDFNGDGKADILWRDNIGGTVIWFINGLEVPSAAALGIVSTDWTIVGTGDFNGDGYSDILWRDNSPAGNLAMWLMNGAQVLQIGILGSVPPVWTIVGTGDFNGDGKTDLLWRDTVGNTSVWFMNGLQVSSSAAIGNVPNAWSVVGTGDFNSDGRADIVWRDASGNTSIWLMNGAAVLSAGGLGNVPTTWSIVQTGDYNGDGMTDLLWQDNLGNTSMWFMNGVTVASTGAVGNIPTNWTVQSANAE